MDRTEADAARMSVRKLADLEVGAELFRTVRRVTRDDLVRYAGASGDFNPIHYRDDFARAVGLPGVICHGMLTMGFAAAPLMSWLGDEVGALLDYGVRFTRPVPVPVGQNPLEEEGVGAQLCIAAKLKSRESGKAVIELSVSLADKNVLGKALATVRI